jgi:hypothetical protein
MKELMYPKTTVILSAVLVALGLSGIFYASAHRADKSSGDLTFENYSKYIKVDCNTELLETKNGSADYFCVVTVSSIGYQKITDLSLGVKLAARDSNTILKSNIEIQPKSYQLFFGDLIYVLPSSETTPADTQEAKIVSLSGKYSYCLPYGGK